MEEQDIEQQEALNPEEQSESTESEEVDVEALKARAAKAEEYKKYADRMAAENKRLKQRPSDDITNTETSSIPSDVTERLDRQELMIKGYSDDEVDFLMQNGGKAALANPIVTEAIKSIRNKAKSKEATPTGTGKSPIFQQYGEKDLWRMPLSELEDKVSQE